MKSAQILAIMALFLSATNAIAVLVEKRGHSHHHHHHVRKERSACDCDKSRSDAKNHEKSEKWIPVKVNTEIIQGKTINDHAKGKDIKFSVPVTTDKPGKPIVQKLEVEHIPAPKKEKSEKKHYHKKHSSSDSSSSYKKKKQQKPKRRVIIVGNNQ